MLRHVTLHEAVTERDRQHAVAAFEALHFSHEADAGLARGREQIDHAAVVKRHHRTDVAADRFHGQRHQFLGALEEIRMRVLLEQHDDVGATHALFGQVAVRIELDADDGFRPDDLAHARDQVAFAVVVAVRRHRAVQAEQHAVERHRGAQLAEDFVAHALVAALRDRRGRLGPEARALDQLEAFLLGAAARHEQWSGAERAAVGMLARLEIERRLEARAAGRHRRERVRLGRERGGEDAHGKKTTPASRQAAG